MTPRLPLVLPHSVISDGAPTELKLSEPDKSASFMAAGPASFAQFTLMSPSPCALACFSISLLCSIHIKGRKLTPYCWATLTSLTSARALTGAISTRNAKANKQVRVDMKTPPVFYALIMPLHGFAAVATKSGDSATHNHSKLRRCLKCRQRPGILFVNQ